MGDFYPIPAGAVVTCRLCGGRLREHLGTESEWRGCSAAEGAVAGATHAVWLVSVERRRASDWYGGGHDTGVVANGGRGGGTAVVSAPAPVQVAAGPRAWLAGPQRAVYVVVPGATITGSTGQAARVFEAIAGSGALGKTVQELRKELKLKAKSLESVLYRLKLAGVIRAHNLADVRRGGGA